MLISEALEILELDWPVDPVLLKEQYWWLVKFYHPDNPATGDRAEFERIVRAYNIVRPS